MYIHKMIGSVIQAHILCFLMRERAHKTNVIINPMGSFVSIMVLYFGGSNGMNENMYYNQYYMTLCIVSVLSSLITLLL